jgi:hypothetical protein
MTIHLLVDRGTPVQNQVFTWRELVAEPYGKLDDDSRPAGARIVPSTQESAQTLAYRQQLEFEGSPADEVAADYVRRPDHGALRDPGGAVRRAAPTGRPVTKTKSPQPVSR